MQDIFDEFVVVDEKAIKDYNNYCKNKIVCYNCGRDMTNNAESAIVTRFTEMSKFASLEFQIEHNYSVHVKDIGYVSELDVPLAQIILWGWNEKGTQVVKDTKLLNAGRTTSFNPDSLVSIVIRILKKRDKIQCQTIINSPDDDFTVQIGEKTVIVSSHWLMAQSPVIQRMLSTEMREKQQRLITLNDLGVDMEQFMEFVEALSPTAIHKPILPNPKNVLVLLKLADFFQVDWLKKRCETHLPNCVEIPLIDRFQLIGHYRLTDLKNFFLHLNVDKLRAFFMENSDKFSSLINSPVSGNLFFELSLRLSAAK
ncbi:hypothetical protein niasHT_031384 [Heterodera trifolii]|uniref:BTB domain-containing protein n=1 Tax=Heterodera trifolii TaxID=157864 RepID=A0ABD2IZZ4_9BILA